MAYRSLPSKIKRNGIIPRGKKTVNVKLNVDSPDGDYLCLSSKQYTEKSSIIQEVTNGDSFITISSFDKNKSALTVHNAEVIVIKNVSNICAEILIKVMDWRNDSGGNTADVSNSVDMNEENSTGEETTFRTWTTVLPAKQFIYLPSNRYVAYSPLDTGTLESAGNAAIGDIDIETKDINSGNEYKAVKLISGTTYGAGSLVLVDDGDTTTTSTEINVDDLDWFKDGDTVRISTEMLRLTSVPKAGVTLTIERAVDGSTAVAIADDTAIAYAFHNHYLPFDVGKCMSDKLGRFKQTGAFFGYARTADSLADGVVVGSVSIGPFYSEGGFLDFGLSGIQANDITGLVASTAYTFHILVDEFTSSGWDGTSNDTAIAFTTDSSDTTFAGSSNAVLQKIQARFDALYYDATATNSLYNKKVTIGLHNGDIRITSHSNHSDTRIGIGNVSGTSPFGVGRFPPLASSVPDVLGQSFGGGTTDTIVYGPISRLASAEITDSVSGKTIINTDAFIYDDGNGNLLFKGAVVGWIDYEKGHCEWTVAELPEAEFQICAESHSAHSGGASYLTQGYNTIQTISARSMNAKDNSKIELLLMG